MFEKFQLNSTTFIPSLGFGTWQLEGEVCLEAVTHALEAGYKAIDTAARYGNHTEVGIAIKQSGIPRSELFITSKIWRDNLGKDDVLTQCKLALQELGLEYLDLYLIHWPNKDIPIEETLEEMAYLKEQKLIRAIGVSNFTIHHLEDALKTGVEITNNQIEVHPTFGQFEMKKFCDEHKIVITAYSPLGQGQELSLPLITELAQKYQKTNAQIILNWLISRGIVAIPRSSNIYRIKENLGCVGWGLSGEDIEKISKLDSGNRLLSPDFAEFSY